MSNANTSTQQQSTNEDKSVFIEQGRSQAAKEVNKYVTDVINNSANVENLCHGCNTGKCDNQDHNKTKSSQ